MTHLEVGFTFNEKLIDRPVICKMVRTINGLWKNKFLVRGLLLGWVGIEQVRIGIYPGNHFNPVHCVCFIENLLSKGAIIRGLVEIVEEQSDGWERGLH